MCIVYEIKIDTSGFENKKRKDWQLQLYNDLCVKLNGLSWVYKTEKGLKDRFDFLQGKGSNLNLSSENNNILLKDGSYGSQWVRKGLPGICTGYVNWLRVMQQVNRHGYVRIPFTSFYDNRAINKALSLERCFVEIRKIK